VAAQAPKPSRRWPPKFETSGAAYIFQPQSGLFFESISKFYYCPKSKTYYNTATGEYFRHNGSSDPETAFELVSVPALTESAETKPNKEQKESHNTNEPAKETTSDGPRKPVVISIGLGNKSKIAKPVSVQKETRESPSPSTSVPAPAQEPIVSASAFGKASADASNILKWEDRKRKEHAEDPSKAAEVAEPTIQSRPGTTALQPTAPVATPTAPVCLLCQRQFPSMEVLARHERESKLHAENLAKAEAMKAAAAATEASKYRDRAQERRSQHPSEEELNPKESQEKARTSKRSINVAHYGPSAAYTTSESLQPALDSSTVPVSSDEANPGNQLLRRMGWSEGSGLGKDGSGGVTPVALDQEAKALAPGTKTGVGVMSNIPPVVYGDEKTYKESLNRATRARFEQLNK
jgi:RNA-binding protein 5/10